MKRRLIIQAAPAEWALPGLNVRAQSFPAKPIRYIVPVSAGGGSDLVGRTVTERWGKVLNQCCVVGNIGGGGGAIACQTTAKAAPDGCTLLQGYLATHGTLKQAAGSFMVHLPYRGIEPAFTDLLGNQTQAMFPGLAAGLPHIRSGRVRAIGVTGTTRHPLLKDVPTMIEAGFKGFDAVQWYGVVGPAGLPAPVLKTLNDSLNSVLATPDMRDKLAAEALDPTPMSPETFGQFIRADIARWTAIARDRKIDLDASPQVRKSASPQVRASATPQVCKLDLNAREPAPMKPMPTPSWRWTAACPAAPTSTCAAGCGWKQFTVLNGISHASFQQKN